MSSEKEKQIRFNTFKDNRMKKLKRNLCICISITLLTLIITPIIIMNRYVNKHVEFKEVHLAEDFGISSEKMTIETSDGINIVVHEVLTQNPKAVIIFLSGIYNPSVTAYFGHAKSLQENGYGSLLLEMRAHGESEGDEIGLGFKEHYDVKAVVDYIKSVDKYKDVPIVVWGTSMGGAVAINSFGQIEEIDGLIGMSAYSSWEDVFADTMINMGIPKIIAKIEKQFLKLYMAFKYGFDAFNISPKNQITRIGQRPALIVHSSEDDEVPVENFNRIMENAPKHVEHWIREGNLHFIVKKDDFFEPYNDIEYWNRILNFLNKNFGNRKI